MNPPLFCPLCYPKQNLRFFFLENSPVFFFERQRVVVVVTNTKHHVRRLVRHHAVRRHEGAVQAQGITTIEYIVVIVFCVLLQSRRFIGFNKRGTTSIRFSHYSGPKRDTIFRFVLGKHFGSSRRRRRRRSRRGRKKGENPNTTTRRDRSNR